MKAMNKGHIAGSRGGQPMIIVELDEPAFNKLEDRTKKGVAFDWVLIGARSYGNVAVATVHPDMLVQEING